MLTPQLQIQVLWNVLRGNLVYVIGTARDTWYTLRVSFALQVFEALCDGRCPLGQKSGLFPESVIQLVWSDTDITVAVYA